MMEQQRLYGMRNQIYIIQTIIYTINHLIFLSGYHLIYIPSMKNKRTSINTVYRSYNIIGMLVREETKEIEISMDNKIVSVKRDTKEYTYKRKIYNFNQIEDDDWQQEKNERLIVKNNKIQALENHPTQPDMPIERNKPALKNNKSHFKYENDAYKPKFRQGGQPNIQKEESYVLLKLLGGLLVILIIMTIFQNYYPESQFNLLRIFNSPIKTNFSTSTNTTKSDL